MKQYLDDQSLVSAKWMKQYSSGRKGEHCMFRVEQFYRILIA